MTKDEALKLALQALETLLDSFQRCEAGYPQHIEMRFAVRDTARIAIDRAKEALAQPEQIDLVREMRDVQGQHGNWNYDPYMQGLYNGLEFAVSLLERREPQFKDAPETWIGDIKVKRDRFNSTEPMTAAHGIKGEA